MNLGDSRRQAGHQRKDSLERGIDAGVRGHWQVPTFAVNLWQGASKPWCVVVPVVNEGQRIRNLLQRMVKLRIASLADVLIVDGGSTDGSLDAEFLREVAVRGLLTKTGPGRLSAQLRCAYAFAMDQGYRGVITIDGNDKDDPGAIPEFVKALESGVDFAQASRFISGGVAENTPKLRDIAIRWIHAPMLRLFSGFPWTDTTQGFRGYSQKLLLSPEVAPFREVFSDYELLAYLSYRVPRLGYRCLELPTSRIYPPGEVPTKISSFRGNLALLKVLFSACLGFYNPRQTSIH